MKYSPPSIYLYRNVFESMKICGLSMIIALGILFITQCFINCTLFYYIGGCLALTAVISPFITMWRPKERIVTDGKAVFITGCDRGFGHMLAQRLDDIGFHVFAGCLFPDGEGAENLRKLASNRLHVVSLDVTSDTSVKEALKYVRQNLNQNELWGIVNNAGITGTGEIPLMSVETFQKILDVNTLGVIRVTKAFLPDLQKSEGRVLVVSSFGGRFPMPWLVAYGMSKRAASYFCEGLRLEMLKWNIQVINIEPTFYSTPMLREGASVPGFLKKWNDTPEEIRKMYSPDYADKFAKSLNRNISILKYVEREPSEVVFVMEDALTSLCPEYNYCPGNFALIILCSILQSVPKSFSDLFMYFISNNGNNGSFM